jgi:hypothetical protein
MMDAGPRLCHGPGVNDATALAMMEPVPVPANSWLHGQLTVLRRHWWLPLAGMLAALLLTAVYLHRATYFYTAELKVYAASSSAGVVRPTSPLGSLAALTGGGSSEQVPPFRYYLDGLYAPEVAARLARDPALMQVIFAGEWDAQRRAWRQPSSLPATLRGALFGLVGLPVAAWQPPDAERLRDFIAATVTVRQSAKSPLATLAFDFPDPVFATNFLARVSDTTDAWLREKQAARTSGNVAYLADRLAHSTDIDVRAGLVAALAEQERQAMLTHAGVPYAAEAFGTATAGFEPARPRPLALLLAGAVTGLILGSVLAFLLGRRPARHG